MLSSCIELVTLISRVFGKFAKYLAEIQFRRYQVEVTALDGAVQSLGFSSEKNTSITSRNNVNVEEPVSLSELGILVTTFEKRQIDLCLPLVASLARIFPEVPITVFINGNLSGSYNRLQRQTFLKNLVTIGNVEVVCSGVMTGISRNWNLGIQLLGKRFTWVLGDDVAVSNKVRADVLSALSELPNQKALVFGFGGFSSFMISRNCIDEVGWFDERYLGIGWEDHDYLKRFELHFARKMPTFFSPHIFHANSKTTGDDHKGYEKYSLFNAVWHEIKHGDGESDKGLIGLMMASGSFEDFHPMQTFRDANHHLLSESSREAILQKTIRD